MSSTSHHMTDHYCATAGDSVSSSPRSSDAMQQQPRVRLMCSFGGKILPRPHDSQLRYVGGDTHIVAVHRYCTFNALLSKLAKSAGATPTAVAIKYQLPNEDLDALISVSTDDDVENMMEEYDRFSVATFKTPRLRLFLFSVGGGDHSRSSSISSLFEGSSTRRDWFFDAINGDGGAAGLERGRSEASSIVSEVPDYLFGLDKPDETREHNVKPRPSFNDNVSISDAGSPAPRVSSPFGSNSYATCVPIMAPELPPVRTKPENLATYAETREIDAQTEISCQQIGGYAANPMWHYAQDAPLTGPAVQPLNVYYVPGPVPPIHIGAPYFQQFGPHVGTSPMGHRLPVSGFGEKFRVTSPPPSIPYEMMEGGRVMGEEVNVNQQHQLQMYYARNGGVVQVFPGMAMPAGSDLQRTGSDPDVE